MSRKIPLVPSALALTAAALVSAAASGQTVHFSTGNQIWTSTNGGTSFSLTDGNGLNFSGSGPQGASIVGLGYGAGNFWATMDNGWLYQVANLGSSNVTLTPWRDLSPGGTQGTTISFDFWGNTLRGMRGGTLITIDNILNLADPINTSSPGQGSSYPSTANIGGQYWGLTNGAGSNITLSRLWDSALPAGTIDAAVSGLTGDIDRAGGSAFDGRFYTSLTLNGDANDLVRFGYFSFDASGGAIWNQLSTTTGTAVTNSMGMVMVIPLPPAAMAGFGTLAMLAGFGGLRRRRVSRA